MSPEIILDFLGEALFLIVMLVSVILIPGLVIGLIVSMFQAATQINEQTLSFLPRLLITLLVIGTAGPWMMNEVLTFTTRLITSIPDIIG